MHQCKYICIHLVLKYKLKTCIYYETSTVYIYNIWKYKICKYQYFDSSCPQKTFQALQRSSSIYPQFFSKARERKKKPTKRVCKMARPKRRSRVLLEDVAGLKSISWWLIFLPESNISHLKMDGRYISFWVSAYFQVQTVSFRECNCWFGARWLRIPRKQFLRSWSRSILRGNCIFQPSFFRGYMLVLVGGLNHQLMIHCWFGARWFGILRVPFSSNSFHKRILGIPNHEPKPTNNHELKSPI